MELGADRAQVSDAGTVVIRVPARVSRDAARSDRAARAAAGRRRHAWRASSSTSARARWSSAATSGSARRPWRTATSRCGSRRSTTCRSRQSSRAGQTTVTPQTQVDVDQETRQLVALEEGTTLADVVRALNTLGRHAARHHRHHAGAQGRGRAARRSGDPVSIESVGDLVQRARAEAASKNEADSRLGARSPDAASRRNSSRCSCSRC